MDEKKGNMKNAVGISAKMVKVYQRSDGDGESRGKAGLERRTQTTREGRKHGGKERRYEERGRDVRQGGRGISKDRRRR